ncbi:unnamed protein product [Hermetia illucens]|uniref:Chitin-binding type-2 domain-containing protein n=1 Tax=Hermetia illucens TaxID=343691 RepID=A0A7R8UGR8_HERIL|nr:unnamed protein product [Hermetia illucens]
MYMRSTQQEVVVQGLLLLCLILAITRTYAVDDGTGADTDNPGADVTEGGDEQNGGGAGGDDNQTGGSETGGGETGGADEGSTTSDYTTECSQLGAYARFKYDDDCKQYVECQVDGTGKLTPCPLGLAYDPDTESCTWTSDVDGCKPGESDSNTADDCPSDASCTGTEILDPMRKICTQPGTIVCEKGESMPKCSLIDTYKGHFIADKEDCASYYYCSDDEKRYKGSCTEGYYFDPARQMCVYKSSLAQCKPIKTSSSSTSTPTAIDWDTVCNGVKSKFIPDPRLCNAYIYCNGDGTPRQDFCPTGTYFNNGSCTKTKPSSCTCESFLTSDATKKYEEYAPDTDKSKYYLCKNGDRILEDCGANSHYDLKTQSCTF